MSKEAMKLAREAGPLISTPFDVWCKRFAELVRADEREACEALHDHEDVLAPIGASSWGEAYQEGWAEGTAAYCEAIRARSKT